MIIPANFLIGALAGAAATYVLKDESARDKLTGVGEKAKSMLGMSKKEEVEETEELAEIVINPSAVVQEDKA